MNSNTLPEEKKLAVAAWPQTTNGGFTSQYFSLKNVRKGWFVILATQAVGHATVFSLRQATAVAGTGAKAGPVARIWANEDVAASDTLVAQTAAASYTVTNDVKKKMIVIEVDPDAFDDTYDVVAFTASDSSQATNFAAATFVTDPRELPALARTLQSD